jgi:uncharacterized RDD family membrane protein YckC
VRVTTRLEVTGHYAGAVSRAAGGVLDAAIVLGTFTAGAAGLDLLTRLVIGKSLDGNRSGPVFAVALAIWALLFVFGSLAIAGRTPGKGIVGIRVVVADGSPLSVRRALARTLALPLSVVPAGLGFAGIVFQREHRALHDLLAGTAVVYDWGNRAAELPGPLSEFLARRAGTQYAAQLPMIIEDQAGDRRPHP